MMKNMYLLIFVIAAISVNIARAQQLSPKVDSQTPVGAMPENDFVGNAWILDFSDEFNGTSVDTRKWTVDHSNNPRAGGHIENGLKEWYWSRDNVEVSDGKLKLKVTKPEEGVMHCASINGGIGKKYEFKYGYVECRMKIANAKKATHTALWLQGEFMTKLTDGKAHNGAEVDIFETAWYPQEQTHLCVHINGYGEHHKAKSIVYPDLAGLHGDEFHTWGFLWSENIMKVYYDGVLKVTYPHQDFIPRCLEYLWLSNGASFSKNAQYEFATDPIGFLTQAEVDYIRLWHPVSNGNLVKNGNFLETGFAENGLQAWQGLHMATSLAPNNNKVIFDDANAIEAPTLRFTGVNLAAYVYQDVEVRSGRIYKLSFDGRTHNANGPSGSSNTNGTKLFADVYALSGGVQGDKLFAVETQSNVNTTLEGYIRTPSGIDMIRVKISKDKGIAFVDNVCLTEVVGVILPSLRFEAKTKTVYIDKLHSDTKISVTFPDGAKYELENNDSKATFSLTDKQPGRYVFNLSGSLQSKTFTINTNSRVE